MHWLNKSGLVIVSNENPEGDIVLTVTRDGKSIYTSESLKGKGQLKYRRTREENARQPEGAQ